MKKNLFNQLLIKITQAMKPEKNLLFTASSISFRESVKLEKGFRKNIFTLSPLPFILVLVYFLLASTAAQAGDIKLSEIYQFDEGRMLEPNSRIISYYDSPVKVNDEIYLLTRKSKKFYDVKNLNPSSFLGQMHAFMKLKIGENHLQDVVLNSQQPYYHTTVFDNEVNKVQSDSGIVYIASMDLRKAPLFFQDPNEVEARGKSGKPGISFMALDYPEDTKSRYLARSTPLQGFINMPGNKFKYQHVSASFGLQEDDLIGFGFYRWDTNNGNKTIQPFGKFLTKQNPVKSDLLDLSLYQLLQTGFYAIDSLIYSGDDANPRIFGLLKMAKHAPIASNFDFGNAKQAWILFQYDNNGFKLLKRFDFRDEREGHKKIAEINLHAVYGLVFDQQTNTLYGNIKDIKDSYYIDLAEKEINNYAKKVHFSAFALNLISNQYKEKIYPLAHPWLVKTNSVDTLNTDAIFRHLVPNALADGKDGYLYGSLGNCIDGQKYTITSCRNTTMLASLSRKISFDLYDSYDSPEITFKLPFPKILSNQLLIDKYSGTGGKFNDELLKGQIFRIKKTDLSYQLLHQFTGEDGDKPSGQMVLKDGYIYGTTAMGGEARAPLFANRLQKYFLNLDIIHSGFNTTLNFNEKTPVPMLEWQLKDQKSFNQDKFDQQLLDYGKRNRVGHGTLFRIATEAITADNNARFELLDSFNGYPIKGKPLTGARPVLLSKSFDGEILGYTMLGGNYRKYISGAYVVGLMGMDRPYLNIPSNEGEIFKVDFSGSTASAKTKLDFNADKELDYVFNNFTLSWHNQQMHDCRLLNIDYGPGFDEKVANSGEKVFSLKQPGYYQFALYCKDKNNQLLSKKLKLQATVRTITEIDNGKKYKQTGGSAGGLLVILILLSVITIRKRLLSTASDIVKVTGRIKKNHLSLSFILYPLPFTLLVLLASCGNDDKLEQQTVFEAGKVFEATVFDRPELAFNFTDDLISINNEIAEYEYLGFITPAEKKTLKLQKEYVMQCVSDDSNKSIECEKTKIYSLPNIGDDYYTKYGWEGRRYGLLQKYVIDGTATAILYYLDKRINQQLPEIYQFIQNRSFQQLRKRNEFTSQPHQFYASQCIKGDYLTGFGFKNKTSGWIPKSIQIMLVMTRGEVGNVDFSFLWVAYPNEDCTDRVGQKYSMSPLLTRYSYTSFDPFKKDSLVASKGKYIEQYQYKKFKDLTVYAGTVGVSVEDGVRINQFDTLLQSEYTFNDKLLLNWVFAVNKNQGGNYNFLSDSKKSRKFLFGLTDDASKIYIAGFGMPTVYDGEYPKDGLRHAIEFNLVPTQQLNHDYRRYLYNIGFYSGVPGLRGR